VQDITVYGVLASLFLLTVILLGVDISNADQYSRFIPQSTTHIHIAALVCSLISFSNCQFNPVKCSGVRQLHLKVFIAIQV